MSSGPQDAPRSAPDSTIPIKAEHNPVVRNLGNTTSLRAAIDAMCAHCMGCTVDHLEPGFRDHIRECSSPVCPLFNFRAYK